jgi:hypothetical protein
LRERHPARGGRFGSSGRWRLFAGGVVLAALGVPSVALARVVVEAVAPDSGFVQPYAGTPKFQQYAPVEALDASEINKPIGAKEADRIARKLGLNKAHAFTAKQYALFISGKGKDGNAYDAGLVDESVRIFTNTTGRPLYADVGGTKTPTVLSSYGLFVDKSGRLMSLANDAAPTKKVNIVLKPGTGYLAKWCRKNGAEDSLEMLYKSAYTSEVVYGSKAQTKSGVDELVPNQKPSGSSTVGMGMAPSIWIVNFAAVYTLNPKLAAYMPARWTGIPKDVVQAIQASPNGQVRYSEYQSYFPG